MVTEVLLAWGKTQCKRSLSLPEWTPELTAVFCNKAHHVGAGTARPPGTHGAVGQSAIGKSEVTRALSDHVFKGENKSLQTIPTPTVVTTPNNNFQTTIFSMRVIQ